MISDIETVSLSKFLSLVLRHKPEAIGITLDENGWTDVALLLEKLHVDGKPFNLEILKHIVDTNAKKRFAFSEDGSKIRASQGHSVTVDPGYEPQQPPEILYHGSAIKNTESILANGLNKQKRTHVHLSTDPETARTVGSRHGKPTLFYVKAAAMHRDGYLFYLSENGVWLTDNVPPQYIIQYL